MHLPINIFRIPLLPAITLSLILMAAFPPYVLAFSEIMNFFVDRPVDALARGGIEDLRREPERADLLAPLSLRSDTAKVETFYEFQRTLRLFDGDWKRTHAWADALATTAVVPFSVGKGISGTVAGGYLLDRNDIAVRNPPEEITAVATDRFSTAGGGFYVDAYGVVRVGVSVVDSDRRKAIEVPLQAEVRPLPFITLGYRRGHDDFVSSVRIRKGAHVGVMPLGVMKSTEEVSARLDLPWLMVSYGNDLQATAARRFEGIVNLPAGAYLVFDHRRRDRSFDQTFFVDGERGGRIAGTWDVRSTRAGIGKSIGDWTFEANYLHRTITTRGGGAANPDAVVSFWPTFILGNYNFLFDGSIKSETIHAGFDRTPERGFTAAMGMQYIDLRTSFTLDYWRSLLFGLGRTGEGSVRLSVERVRTLFLSAGAGYRWKYASINYGIGQVVPLSVTERGKEKKTAGGGNGGGGGSSFDPLRHHPGGNIQRILLTFFF